MSDLQKCQKKSFRHVPNFQFSTPYILGGRDAEPFGGHDPKL
jgi:hypothetical protein